MNKQNIVVLTGAGISAESGLSTYRDSDGLWENHRIEDVCTPEAFQRNPQLVLDFYNARRRQAAAASPDAAHRALAALEQFFTVHIITQNVDTLHERAGSSRVLHLHGQLDKARSTVDEGYVIDCPGDQHLSDRDPAGNPMRPHIVWFGEAVPLLEVAAGQVSRADRLIIVGTSLQVYPASGLVNYVRPGTPIYLIDPRPPQRPGVEIIAAPATVGVPQLCEELIAGLNG